MADERLRLIIDAVGNTRDIGRTSDELRKLDRAYKDAGLSADQSKHLMGQWDQQVAGGAGTRKSLSTDIDGIAKQFSGALPAGILAGGAALGAFAVKAIGDFQNVALEAGHLSDATGLAVDEASRWIEVGGDVGVSAEQMGTSFGYLSKQIGKNPAEFQALGITAQDANGQILQAIDLLNRVPAGADRSALAAKLFGRSWAEMSELIEQGAGKVSDSLKEVSDAKVIDEKELENARRFREMLDTITGAVEGISLAVGGELVGELTVFAELTATIAENLERLKMNSDTFSIFGDILGASLGPLGMVMGDVGENLALLNETQDKEKAKREAANAAWNAAHGSLRAFEGEVDLATQSIELNNEATQAQIQQQGQADAMVDGLTTRWRDAKSAVDNYALSILALSNSDIALQQADLNVANALDRVKTAMETAKTTTDNAKTSVNEHEAANRAAYGASLDLQSAINQYGAQALQTAAEQRGLNVEQLSGKEKSDILRGALQQLADKNPELRAQIQGTIDKLDAYDGTQASATMTADGSQAQAEAAATKAAVDRVPTTHHTTFVASTAGEWGRGYLGLPGSANGGHVRGMAGGGVGMGIPTRVNEQGQEMAMIPRGTRIGTAGSFSKRRRRTDGSSMVFNVLGSIDDRAAAAILRGATRAQRARR